MSVPVVILAGDRYASRFGSSALVNLGLRDLVADSVDGYVELAVKLAGDRQRLVELRSSLRPKMRESCLLDAKGFTRRLEAAYREMWVARCGSQPSRSS
jgi:predicted O-linked N-acetylglucosamine transferase (SPINDLY family)